MEIKKLKNGTFAIIGSFGNVNSLLSLAKSHAHYNTTFLKKMANDNLLDEIKNNERKELEYTRLQTELILGEGLDPFEE